MAEDKRVASRINLTLEFHGTTRTPRFSAQDFARHIEAYFAHTFGTEGTTARVQSAFLNHTQAWRAEMAEAQEREHNPYGNPDTDALN